MQTTTSGTGSVATSETGNLISSDKVEGTAVYNRAGDRLGSVYTVMIDKVSGQVKYAVMSFGGFLGVGKKYHPLPWNALTYDTGRSGYVVDVDKERLSAAPSYDENESPDWINPAYGRRIDEYYGRGASTPPTSDSERLTRGMSEAGRGAPSRAP
jgi:sporulation protein YlmC with PRC-barrel domain